MDKLTQSRRSLQITEVISNFLRMLANMHLDSETPVEERRFLLYIMDVLFSWHSI